MRINGNDISIYGARQWNVTPAFSALTNKSQWAAGAALPLLLESEVGMKRIKVSVMMEGENRGAIWRNANRLVAALLKPVEIKLDGFPNLYHVVLSNATYAELSLQKYHKATLEFIGYEHGEENTVKGGMGKRFYVEILGDIETPAVIEIKPLIGKASLTIKGIVWDCRAEEDRPVTISKLTARKTIVLDGETGLITEDGANKIGDVDIWGLPMLRPGTNLLELDQEDVEWVVRYKPRFV